MSMPFYHYSLKFFLKIDRTSYQFEAFCAFRINPITLPAASIFIYFINFHHLFMKRILNFHETFTHIYATKFMNLHVFPVNA